MPDLSADEQRYLIAAFSAMPRDWFRPQAVGHALAFSDRQSEQITESLAAAGMLTANPGCHARLTGQGRKAAARLASTSGRSRWRSHAAGHRVTAIAWLVAIAGTVLALLWFAEVV